MAEVGANAGLAFCLASFERLVSFRRQIAGVGIQRLQQTVQRAVSHRRQVRLFYIFAAHPGQHFAVNLKLRIGAVVVGGTNAPDLSRQREKQNTGRGYKNG